MCTNSLCFGIIQYRNYKTLTLVLCLCCVKAFRNKKNRFLRPVTYKSGSVIKTWCLTLVLRSWVLRLRHAAFMPRDRRLNSARSVTSSWSVVALSSMNWWRNVTAVRHSDTRRLWLTVKYSLNDCNTHICLSVTQRDRQADREVDICLSLCPSLYLSVYPSVCLSVRPCLS